MDKQTIFMQIFDHRSENLPYKSEDLNHSTQNKLKMKQIVLLGVLILLVQSTLLSNGPIDSLIKNTLGSVVNPNAAASASASVEVTGEPSDS